MNLKRNKYRGSVPVKTLSALRSLIPQGGSKIESTSNDKMPAKRKASLGSLPQFQARSRFCSYNTQIKVDSLGPKKLKNNQKNFADIIEDRKRSETERLKQYEREFIADTCKEYMKERIRNCTFNIQPTTASHKYTIMQGDIST